jgi:hypothetical protein
MQGSRLFLILALASVAAPALADWKQDYARGVEAAGEMVAGVTPPATCKVRSLATRRPKRACVCMASATKSMFLNTTPAWPHGARAIVRARCATGRKAATPTFIKGFP